MKVELKHILPYFHQELTGIIGDSKNLVYVELLSNRSICTGVNIKGVQSWYKISHFKPALKPLSDYTDMFGLPMDKLGCDLGDQAIIEEFANKKISLASLPYSAYEVLVRNKVDVFGLIPEGLAIDINTLNP